MKRFNRISAILLTGLLLLAVTDTMAQRSRNFRGRGMGMFEGPQFNKQFQRIPDLTADQKEKIKDLRIDQMKKMTQFRNKLMENGATLRQLQSQEDPDMEAINKTIEEMGQVRTEMHKARAENHQKIREILTEEQRAFFDARILNRHGMANCGGQRPMRGRPFGPGN